MAWRAIRIGTGAIVGSWFVVSSVAAQQPVVCTSNCAKITVVGATGTAGGDPVTIKVSYQQGPNDSEEGQGNDDTAAIAFTLGMPGSGSGSPLRLANCEVNGEGLTSAIRVGSAISAEFKVVVENLQCSTVSGAPRNRCLCPDAGQERDNFMNVVVYGPKELPGTGPVVIPRLPDGDLLEIDLAIDEGGTRSLHIFSETDSQSEHPKPQFGAFLSIGDQAAIDQTFDREANPNVSRVEIVNAEVRSPTACIGDCNSDNVVTIDELVKGVSIALVKMPFSECPQFDSDASLSVTVNELTTGVGNALDGCDSP